MSKTKHNKTTKKKQSQNKPVKKIRFSFRIAIILAIIIAGIGAYFLVFAGAAPNNCSEANDNYGQYKICDINQVSSPNGTDALVSVDGEASTLASTQGWRDWGVAFRAPTKSVNGAKPVYRFHYPELSIHALAIEGSAEYNKYIDLVNQGKASNEGPVFYAWTASHRPPEAVPIYTITRKPWYFLALYTADWGAVDYFVSHTDGTYEFAGDPGGINFYAYPANYFPPKPANTPTKDKDCANQNLQQGDKGACVQWHKGVLNGYVAYHGNKSAKLDTSNNTFDSKTSDYTRVFVNSLKEKGVKVSAFSNVVTKEIWDALAKGYPAAAPTPTPTKPPTPARTNTPKNNNKTSTNKPSVNRSNSNKQSGANTDNNCPTIEVALLNKGRSTSGLPLNERCINVYQAYSGAKVDGKWGPETALKVQAKIEQNRNDACPPGQYRPDSVGAQRPCVAIPSNNGGNSGPTSSTTKRSLQFIKQLSPKDSHVTKHINVWINDDKIVSGKWAEKNDWDIHIICDIVIYPNLGLHGVWAYQKGLNRLGDQESCTYKRNGFITSIFDSGGGGHDGVGDKYITKQLSNKDLGFNYDKEIKLYTGPGKY